MNYTLPEFLAHAIALEQEAADRYLELADMMEAHRNDPVSALFRDMVHYSRLHHDSIVERAQGVTLPQLRSVLVIVVLLLCGEWLLRRRAATFSTRRAISSSRAASCASRCSG